ncbi:MAG: aspartate carbamoyltransferase [DPANN group archaeon]|nr:aspartate carbamoyltransferase [DPANN group archaeon]
MNFRNRNFVSLHDFSKEEIEHVFKTADSIHEKKDICAGKILATLFYEPSTRTRLSFESAMHRLGGNVIGFTDIATTSVKKGETIADTGRSVECYSDIIVLRHPDDGAAKIMADYTKVPIINGGDGSHQHPTQTLLDMYTIRQELGKLKGLKIGICGDLKYGRTAHSLAEGLSLYNNEFIFASPEELKLPDYAKRKLDEKNIKYEEKRELKDTLDVDVLYMTRIQKERFHDPIEYERVKNNTILTKELGQKTNALIMHPLPRVNEIAYEIDEKQNAAYFRQMKYGVTVRMALISLLLGVVE